VFFASAEAFGEWFDFKEEDISRVRIDVTEAHFWDLTAVNALDRVVFKFRQEGKQVEVIGLNAASAGLVDRLGTHHKEGSTAQFGH
jgi:SulP family sulfate permease